MNKYNRVLLKLSGEALKGNQDFGLNSTIINEIAKEIEEVHKTGVQIAIVVGGGNLWRGKTAEELGMERTQGDHIGMLATVMNGLALQDALENLNINTTVMSGLDVPKAVEPFIQRNAMKYLNDNNILIFVGGTGSPYFSTDTASSLRAAQIKADVILMAKNGTKGVYDKDPNTNKDAIMYEKLTFNEIVKKELQVMDLTAATMCKDNNIKIKVFDMNEKGNILRAVKGENIGTVIEGKKN